MTTVDGMKRSLLLSCPDVISETLPHIDGRIGGLELQDTLDQMHDHGLPNYEVKP